MSIKLKVAGTTNVGLKRTNNEDNFLILNEISLQPAGTAPNREYILTPRGTLLVVADGMGGANAGEVASQIAVDTMRELFTPARIDQIDLDSSTAVNDFIVAAISEADRRIKETAAVRPETKGMGTTIVLAWLIEGKLYIAWCGDSRAYLYNPASGLGRLTKDHSYVQTLVDMGQLTDDEAFDSPQSNIITRCLCDYNQPAEIDLLRKPIPLADGDIILLCTDGLCGMIRDREIEAILANSSDSDPEEKVNSLIQGALDASGSDNVTVALLEVISGAGENAASVADWASSDTNSDVTISNPTTSSTESAKNKRSLLLYLLGGILLGCLVAWLVFGIDWSKNSDSANANNVAATDTVVIDDFAAKDADTIAGLPTQVQEEPKDDLKKSEPKKEATPKGAQSDEESEPKEVKVEDVKLNDTPKYTPKKQAPQPIIGE